MLHAFNDLQDKTKGLNEGEYPIKTEQDTIDLLASLYPQSNLIGPNASSNKK